MQIFINSKQEHAILVFFSDFQTLHETNHTHTLQKIEAGFIGISHGVKTKTDLMWRNENRILFTIPIFIVGYHTFDLNNLKIYNSKTMHLIKMLSSKKFQEITTAQRNKYTEGNDHSESMLDHT